MVHLRSINIRSNDNHIAFRKLFVEQRDVQSFMLFTGIGGDSYNYGCICSIWAVDGTFREDMTDKLPKSRVILRIKHAN